LPQGTVSFPVPSTAKSYEIRVSVQDAAGNWAHQRLGPRPVEPPIRFVGFRENEVLLSRSREKILWSLHATAEEYLDELRVSLEFLARTADEWLMLRDDLKADEAFYWQVPAADPQEHRLRLRLFRRNDIVGEDVSAAFRIAPIDGDVIARSLGPALPAGLSKASLTALEAADTEYTRYREASVGPGSVSAAQLDGLLQRARRAYEKAIELDDKNHGATFGLAQLLENADPERFRQESLELLKKTVAIEANHPLALNDLGAAYIREGEYLEAEPYLRNSLKARPTAKAYYNLGLALLFQGKGEAAREQFELALRKEDPALPEGDVYYYVVYTYLVEERVDDARDSYLSKRSVIPVELQRDLDQRLR
ncbi:MAG: tetratricopeptide repeat protein, partial [Planctomycetota bacterium]|nr:tetratricopeptide repeat protein [Planctomycetota bacterium]